LVQVTGKSLLYLYLVPISLFWFNSCLFSIDPV
jgi:hypothetical protein